MYLKKFILCNVTNHCDEFYSKIFKTVSIMVFENVKCFRISLESLSIYDHNKNYALLLKLASMKLLKRNLPKIIIS